MQLSQSENKSKFKQVTLFFKWPILISLVFFIASLPNANANYFTVLKICLGYALSISSFIYFSYYIADKTYQYLESRKKIQLEFNQKTELIICFLGLVPGAILGQLIKAKILNEPTRYGEVPFVILVGLFISLAFIYFYSFKLKMSENEDLVRINKNLKERKTEIQYLEKISSKIGNKTQIIAVADINYFESKDHCTFAKTNESEFIVDYSIKYLTEHLNPLQFIQIHRSTIVKLEKIKSIENKNLWELKLDNGDTLKVSRSNQKRLKETLLN
ncbi:hypothetical protein A9Q84_08015 [Halobacteriovorax marinus]|uniref:HTH LytTR-type domain-containing protein n=1 Tax=Halobacteriovorax marinus TaxID=97084 RepID=A0A1Y5F678_9BACT|nr:hypothetical protein A9Q84_08015 [Halobacteriovorax marinus]